MRIADCRVVFARLYLVKWTGIEIIGKTGMREVTILTETDCKEAGREITGIADAITREETMTDRLVRGSTRDHRPGEKTVIIIDTGNAMREAGAETGETSPGEDHVVINTSPEGIKKR